MSFGLGQGSASIYFEPRDSVVCRFPSRVRVRLLDARLVLADESLVTTAEDPVSGETADGPLSIDVRHWARVVVDTSNRDPDSADEACTTEHQVSATRVEVVFPNGESLSIDTDKIGGCGGLFLRPVTSVGATEALSDITDPNYDLG